jgi:hypothetical protein
MFSPGRSPSVQSLCRNLTDGKDLAHCLRLNRLKTNNKVAEAVFVTHQTGSRTLITAALAMHFVIVMLLEILLAGMVATMLLVALMPIIP